MRCSLAMVVVVNGIVGARSIARLQTAAVAIAQYRTANVLVV